jgi:hypothetical protein
MDDSAEDHAAIQSAISQLVFYPLSEFDGKMKTKDSDAAGSASGELSSGFVLRRPATSLRAR